MAAAAGESCRCPPVQAPRRASAVARSRGADALRQGRGAGLARGRVGRCRQISWRQARGSLRGRSHAAGERRSLPPAAKPVANALGLPGRGQVRWPAVGRDCAPFTPCDVPAGGKVGTVPRWRACHAGRQTPPRPPRLIH